MLVWREVIGCASDRWKPANRNATPSDLSKTQSSVGEQIGRFATVWSLSPEKMRRRTTSIHHASRSVQCAARHQTPWLQIRLSNSSRSPPPNLEPQILLELLRRTKPQRTILAVLPKIRRGQPESPANGHVHGKYLAHAQHEMRVGIEGGKGSPLHPDRRHLRQPPEDPSDLSLEERLGPERHAALQDSRGGYGGDAAARGGRLRGAGVGAVVVVDELGVEEEGAAEGLDSFLFPVGGFLLGGRLPGGLHELDGDGVFAVKLDLDLSLVAVDDAEVAVGGLVSAGHEGWWG